MCSLPKPETLNRKGIWYWSFCQTSDFKPYTLQEPDPGASAGGAAPPPAPSAVFRMLCTAQRFGCWVQRAGIGELGRRAQKFLLRLQIVDPRSIAASQHVLHSQRHVLHSSLGHVLHSQVPRLLLGRQVLSLKTKLHVFNPGKALYCTLGRAYWALGR